MTALLTAGRPRRLTALERTAMTPEQELELLIAEQQRDDVCWVTPSAGQVSLDASVTDPGGYEDGGTVGSELLGYDPWPLVEAAIDLGLDPAELAFSGDLVSYLRLPGLTDVRHGTLTGYRKQGCRCPRCRAAQAAHQAEYRARKRAEA